MRVRIARSSSVVRRPSSLLSGAKTARRASLYRVKNSSAASNFLPKTQTAAHPAAISTPPMTPPMIKVLMILTILTPSSFAARSSIAAARISSISSGV